MKPTALPSFNLTDHHGTKVTERDYRGKYMLAFFGFSHCQVVCPRALNRLSQVLEQLGPQADHFVPLYVTVDPERDTPETLRKYLASTAPQFTGLTGEPEQINTLKEAFKVHVRRVEDPNVPDGYKLPHTAFTYVLGPAGEFLMHLPDALDSDAMTDRLKTLLAQSETQGHQ